MKRNLSGIYIIDDGEPTCFEDCDETTQDDWLDTLDRESLAHLAKKLGCAIKDMGEQFDILKDF
jgi:hypothetical protein